MRLFDLGPLVSHRNDATRANVLGCFQGHSLPNLWKKLVGDAGNSHRVRLQHFAIQREFIVWGRLCKRGKAGRQRRAE